MLQNLRDFLKARGGRAVTGKALRDLFVIQPSLEVGDDGALAFDFGVRSKLGEYVWPDCLPGPVSTLQHGMARRRSTVQQQVQITRPGLWQRSVCCVQRA